MSRRSRSKHHYNVLVKKNQILKCFRKFNTKEINVKKVFKGEMTLS